MDASLSETAHPRLTPDEMAIVRRSGRAELYADGSEVLRSGQADVDFFVVASGAVEVTNPADGGRHIALHRPGEFVGDVDLLTRRPVVIDAVARGETELVRVEGRELRRLLGTVPRLGEKLLTAFTRRRELLAESGVAGLRVVGETADADTTLVREFLFKNWVPYTFVDVASVRGRALLAEFGRDADETPLVECGPGVVLGRPSLRELADCAGVKRPCPEKTFDLAIVGAGPAGMAAAVYASSEGLSTVVLDRLGPGGQAGGSSLIENFIGFPSGLSGNELASRGMLQMLKFGSLLLTPVEVRGVEPDGGALCVVTDEHRVRARVVLAATGAIWRRLPAKDAARFERNGVYYSATAVEQRTCSGRPVLVVGAGNSGAQAAMYLSECSPKVYYAVRQPELGPGMSSYMVERVRTEPRVEVLTDAEVISLHGGDTLEAVTLGTPTGVRRLDVAAVFVFIGAEPNAGWLPDTVARDERGYVLTGDDVRSAGRWPLERAPVPLETSLPGLLAAGDLRAGSTKRVGFAVGDGSLAVTSVHRLLDRG